MNVLSKVPGYGGYYICEVIGQNEMFYALRYHAKTFRKKKKDCIGLTDSEGKEDGSSRKDRESS